MTETPIASRTVHRLDTSDAPISKKKSDPNFEEVGKLIEGLEDVFIPDGDDVSLMEVKGWFKLPDDLAYVMGAPGIPYGKVVMAMGKKDSGKTTFATQCLIAAQQQGGLAILLDTEKKFNLKRATDMGLDPTRLVIIQADTVEKAFSKFKETIDKLRTSPRFKNSPFMCVWDSLGQTPTEAEVEADAGQFAMAAAAVIKGNMRRTVRWLDETNTALVIINQVYANMNVFGKKTTPYGGSGPEYASVVVLEFAAVGRVRPKGVKAEAPEGKNPMAGTKSKIKCEKNHVGQPFREIEVVIDWRGFCFGRDVEYAPTATEGMPEGEKVTA